MIKNPNYYNLLEDIGQSNNLVESYSEKLQEMVKACETVRRIEK
jgi:hypothetical protein